MKMNDDSLRMRLSKRRFAIPTLVAVMGLAGCEEEGTAERAGKKIDEAAEKAGDKLESAGRSIEEKAENAGEYLNDSAITAKIKSEILAEPLLKASQINVITTGGVVKLTGVVDSQQSIDKIMEIVRSDTSVRSVENGLVVKGGR